MSDERMTLAEILAHVVRMTGHTDNAKSQIRAKVEAAEVGLQAATLEQFKTYMFAGRMFCGEPLEQVKRDAELPHGCLEYAEIDWRGSSVQRQRPMSIQTGRGNVQRLYPVFRARGVTARRRDVEHLWPVTEKPDWRHSGAPERLAETNGARRPSLRERDLNDCLGELLRQQVPGAVAPTEMEMREHVRQKFPHHHVARQRVRDWRDANISPENRRQPGQKATGR